MRKMAYGKDENMMNMKVDFGTDLDGVSNSFKGTLLNATSSGYDWGKIFLNTVPIAYMPPRCVMKLEIENVIFNPPATIVFWKDKTKTVVKCGENDVFDPEKAIALCIAKKALGNKGNYYNHIKKWLPKVDSKHQFPIAKIFDKFRKSIESINWPETPIDDGQK